VSVNHAEEQMKQRQHSLVLAAMALAWLFVASEAGADLIRFGEFPVGTHVTGQYFPWTFSSNLPFAEIGIDLAATTNPVLVATDFSPTFPGAVNGMDAFASFFGPILARTTIPMASVQVDVGFIGNPGSVSLSAFDRNGVLIGQGVASAGGFNTLRVDDAAARIVSIALNAVHDASFGFGRGPFEFRGYSVDNFAFRWPESANELRARPKTF